MVILLVLASGINTESADFDSGLIIDFFILKLKYHISYRNAVFALESSQKVGIIVILVSDF